MGGKATQFMMKINKEMAAATYDSFENGWLGSIANEKLMSVTPAKAGIQGAEVVE